MAGSQLLTKSFLWFLLMDVPSSSAFYPLKNKLLYRFPHCNSESGSLSIKSKNQLASAGVVVCKTTI